MEQPQNQDGVAHFCYHDPTMNLSFAWDGFALEIDVFRDDTLVGQMPIPVGYISTSHNPGRWLAHFEVLCGLYIKERHDEIAAGSDPDRRSGGWGLAGEKESETTTR
jgi:hypothetical protein